MFMIQSQIWKSSKYLLCNLSYLTSFNFGDLISKIVISIVVLCRRKCTVLTIPSISVSHFLLLLALLINPLALTSGMQKHSTFVSRPTSNMVLIPSQNIHIAKSAT